MNKKEIEKTIIDLDIKSFSNKNPRIDLDLLKSIFLREYSEQLRLDENLYNFIKTCKEERCIKSCIDRNIKDGETDFPTYEISWSYLDKFESLTDKNIELYFGEVLNEDFCYYEGFLKILFYGKEIAILNIKY